MFLFGGILHRVIFWELVKVFALTLTALTGLFLIGLVIQQANQLGLSLFQTLQAIPLLIPYTLPYTIPATTLFASCVVYGRVAHDNEAVAMKAAGVNLHSILKPAVVLGLLASAVTFALAHSVIPHSQTALQQRLLQNPEELLYNLLRRDRTFKAANFPYVIHVRDVVGQRLIDVVVKRKAVRKDENGKDQPTGDYDYVLRAREAKLRVVVPDADHPNDPPMLYIDPDRWTGGDGKTILSTDANRPIGVVLPDVFSQKDVKNRPMNLVWDELPARADEVRGVIAGYESKQQEAVKAAAAATDVNVREHWSQTIQGYTYLIKDQIRTLRNTENEYYMRPALSLSCLVFAIIGCPVGIRANRADYLSSFVTCFLPTVAVYYPLLLAGSNMGRDGKVPLPLGVFAADVILSAAAVVLILKLIRR